MSFASSFSETDKNLMVEAMVKKVIEEMAMKSTKTTGKSVATEETVILNPSSSETDISKMKKRRKSKKLSKDKKNSRGKTKKKNKTRTKVLEQLLDVLENLKGEKSSDERTIPPMVLVKDLDKSNHIESSDLSNNSMTVGSTEFYHDILRKLGPSRNILCIQDASVDIADDIEGNNGNDLDFEVAFGPNDMRCLALVSHNEMKATMKDFVIQNKHILKKFRLTGTNSTMKMLAEVFADEPDIVFGPSCKSGPLGGDAELVALMTGGKLGGILFFQDPMTSHPHQCDIECLVRQALVYNTLMANTPTSAMALIEVFKMALMGVGKAEVIPSFFFDLQSPTVQSYKNNQANVVNSHRL
jgi:methylglyoxal synthase